MKHIILSGDVDEYYLVLQKVVSNLRLDTDDEKIKLITIFLLMHTISQGIRLEVLENDADMTDLYSFVVLKMIERFCNEPTELARLFEKILKEDIDREFLMKLIDKYLNELVKFIRSNIKIENFQ